MEETEKNKSPEFRPKVTPTEVNKKLGEDKKAAAKKAKPKKEGSKAIEFPLCVRINDYGFLGFRKPLLEALSWHKGEKLTIGKNADGSATLRKAE